MSPDRLHAPWRANYVRNAHEDQGCVLCRIGEDRDNDVSSFVLHRRDGLYVVLNRYPYINGHLMIAPQRHVPHLSGLDPEELRCLADLMVTCEIALLSGMSCSGINGGWNLGGCAGAGVEGHIHLHMLPRWSGDVNFMTTTMDTRVISASLEDSYERLKPFFEEE